MSSHTAYKWANLILLILAIAGLLGIEFNKIPNNSILKAILWFIIGLWVGLTAYLGQKTNYEKTIKSADEERAKMHKRLEELERKIKS